MLQETQRRLRGLDCGPTTIVCNAEHRFMVAEQLREETVGEATIILEPAGRNTAPAIALAALQAVGRARHPRGASWLSCHASISPRHISIACQTGRRNDLSRNSAMLAH